MTKQYVVYRRVSTTEQGKSGLGMDAQRRDLHLFFESYADEPSEVIGEFEDIDSGMNNNRPGLAKAIEMAKARKAFLIVSKLDRLSRRMSFIAMLMEDKSIEFKVAEFPRADNFHLHISAAMAEQERDFASKRTRAALAAAKARGVKLGGYRAAAALAANGRAADAQARAERLRTILTPMVTRRDTLQDMADALNNVNLRSAWNKQWSPQTIHRVLKRLGLTRAEVKAKTVAAWG